MENLYYINQGIQPGAALRYNIARAGCGKLSPDFNIERTSSYPYSVIHYVAEGHGFVIHKNLPYIFISSTLSGELIYTNYMSIISVGLNKVDVYSCCPIVYSCHITGINPGLSPVIQRPPCEDTKNVFSMPTIPMFLMPFLGSSAKTMPS